MASENKQKLNNRFLFIHLAAMGIWALVLIPLLGFYIKLIENTDIINDLAQHDNPWAVWSHFLSFIGLPFLCIFIWYAVALYITAFILIYQAKKMKDCLSREEIEEYLSHKKGNGFFYVNRFKRNRLSNIFHINESSI